MLPRYPHGAAWQVVSIEGRELKVKTKNSYIRLRCLCGQLDSVVKAMLLTDITKKRVKKKDDRRQTFWEVYKIPYYSQFLMYKMLSSHYITRMGERKPDINDFQELFKLKM